MDFHQLQKSGNYEIPEELFSLLKLYQDVHNNFEQIKDGCKVNVSNHLQIDAKQEQFFRLVVEKVSELQNFIKEVVQIESVKYKNRRSNEDKPHYAQNVSQMIKQEKIENFNQNQLSPQEIAENILSSILNVIITEKEQQSEENLEKIEEHIEKVHEENQIKEDQIKENSIEEQKISNELLIPNESNIEQQQQQDNLNIHDAQDDKEQQQDENKLDIVQNDLPQEKKVIQELNKDVVEDQKQKQNEEEVNDEDNQQEQSLVGNELNELKEVKEKSLVKDGESIIEGQQEKEKEKDQNTLHREENKEEEMKKSDYLQIPIEITQEDTSENLSQIALDKNEVNEKIFQFGQLFSQLSQGLTQFSLDQFEQIYDNIKLEDGQLLSIAAYGLNSASYVNQIFHKIGFAKFQQKDMVQKEFNEFLKGIFSLKNDEMFVLDIQTVSKGMKIIPMKKVHKTFRKENKMLLSQLQESLVISEKMFRLEEIVSQKYKVKIFFPRKFEALRAINKIYLKDFIMSISISHDWDTSGGKKALSFQKSNDQKYIFKQIKKLEFDSLKEFAYEYFVYYFNCQIDNRPTLLTKIYGMYQINTAQGKHYFIVLENLYYGVNQDQNVVKTYDLKGSERNRFISNPDPKTCLLDTNFKVDRNGEPIPVKAVHKDYMNFAIHNDTLFLQRHKIIDYSLLLIMDTKNRLIRMGIIDYLRKFTFDKKMEQIYKEMVSGVKPTIVKPLNYKNRFRESMQQYFMPVHVV